MLGDGTDFVTKLRIVLRPYLGRPYVVEEAQCVALLPKGKGKPEAHFGPYIQISTHGTEKDARDFVKHRMSDKVIEDFYFG